jgi:hypothetical protein
MLEFITEKRNTHPEGKIILLEGTTIDAYPIELNGPANESRADKETELNLFIENAHFLFAQRKRFLIIAVCFYRRFTRIVISHISAHHF